MVDTKTKVEVKFIALLTPFRLLFDTSEGYSIDVQIAKCMESTAKNVVNIDLNKGIEIGPRVILRLSSKEDRERLKKFQEPMGNSILINAYVLESTIESEDSPSLFFEAWEKVDNNMNCVINAFRLLKPGHIEANIRLSVKLGDSKEQPSLYRNSSIPRDDYFHKAYELETIDLLQVKGLAEKIASVDFSRRSTLRIALDRFERSYYEPYLEDQLIDYMIAFESLFIGKKMREQSTVIPVAAAMLLGTNEDSRQEITKMMELAYDIRNCIVHGSDYEQKLHNNKIEMRVLTKEVENVLRNSLKKLL